MLPSEDDRAIVVVGIFDRVRVEVEVITVAIEIRRVVELASVLENVSTFF